MNKIILNAPNPIVGDYLISTFVAMEKERETTDMMGRKVLLKGVPTRIVSLVPSQTELLHHFGLDNEVLGITKFCISPESWWRSKQRVGGTKNVNREAIAALQPDLIIGNKEENTSEDIEWLSERFPVWMSDIYTFSDALRMIKSLGQITGKGEEADRLCLTIEKNFSSYTPLVHARVAYLIWNDPPMAVNGSTYIGDMLRLWGVDNVFENHSNSRYPITSVEELQSLSPDFLLLSSEPFPFSEEHQMDWSMKLSATKVLLVDGESFSWYGSRMLSLPIYFNRLNNVCKKEDERHKNEGKLS